MDLAGCRASSAWCWGPPDCQLLAEERGRLRRSHLMPEGKSSPSAQNLSVHYIEPLFCFLWVPERKSFGLTAPHRWSALQLGEQEQVVQYVLSHWSLVQTYFKAGGSQQGSYVLLLIFTSIQSTLSKSTQWDLYRVINRSQLSGLPVPCSKSLPFPSYTWHSWILCLTFPLTTIH